MSVNKSFLSLPHDKLPECWKDETRMNVLFAPVRNRSVNPQDWESKLSFWSNLMFNCCVHSQVYTFRIDDFKKVFTLNGRTPSCLILVFDEMYKSGDIKPVAEFLQKPAETWSRWAADVFIKKPIVWSLSKVKNSFISPNVTDQTFVHLAAVEANADTLITSLPEQYKDKILNLHELLSVTGIDANKVDDFKLVLHHLVCRNKADIKEITSDNSQDDSLHNLLIRFGDTDIVKSISDSDVSIYMLEQSEKALSSTITKLEDEVQTILLEAKSYLNKGQRQIAKRCLRKKHEIDSRITKRANALQNIQILLLKVRDIDADSHVLDSYKVALSTLKKTFKEDLSEEDVADTMMEIADVLEEHEDIQSSLAQSITNTIDEEELEAELAELLANDGDDQSPPLQPLPVELVHIDDPDTIALEKRLEILKLPLSSSTTPVTDQKDEIAL